MTSLQPSHHENLLDKAVFPSGGITCTPASKEHAYGWGKPFADSEGHTINPPLGTPQANDTANRVRLTTSNKTVPNSLLKTVGRGVKTKVGNMVSWTKRTTAPGQPDKYYVVTFKGPPSNWIYDEDRFGYGEAAGFRDIARPALPASYAEQVIYYGTRKITTDFYPLMVKVIDKDIGEGKTEARMYTVCSDQFSTTLSIKYTKDFDKPNPVWTTVRTVSDYRDDSHIVGTKFSTAHGPVVASFTGSQGELFVYSVPQFNSDCSKVVFLMCALAVRDSTTPGLPSSLWNYYSNPLYNTYPDLQKYLVEFSSSEYKITRIDADDGCVDSVWLPAINPLSTEFEYIYQSHVTIIGGYRLPPFDGPRLYGNITYTAYTLKESYAAACSGEQTWKTKSPDCVYFGENDVLSYVWTTTNSVISVPSMVQINTYTAGFTNPNGYLRMGSIEQTADFPLEFLESIQPEEYAKKQAWEEGLGPVVHAYSTEYRQTAKDITTRTMALPAGSVVLATKNLNDTTYRNPGSATAITRYASAHVHRMDYRDSSVFFSVPQSLETPDPAGNYLDYKLQIAGSIKATTSSNATNYAISVDNQNSLGCSGVADPRYGCTLFSSNLSLKNTKGCLNWASNGTLESITGTATGAPGDTVFTYYPINSF